MIEKFENGALIPEKDSIDYFTSLEKECQSSTLTHCGPRARSNMKRKHMTIKEQLAECDKLPNSNVLFDLKALLRLCEKLQATQAKQPPSKHFEIVFPNSQALKEFKNKFGNWKNFLKRARNAK